jgi:hypothetical protein
VGCRKTYRREFPYSGSIRQGFSCRLSLDIFICLAAIRNIRKSPDSRHPRRRAWPPPEWHNLMFCFESCINAFLFRPPICQIRAFRASWPRSQLVCPGLQPAGYAAAHIARPIADRDAQPPRASAKTIPHLARGWLPKPSRHRGSAPPPPPNKS